MPATHAIRESLPASSTDAEFDDFSDQNRSVTVDVAETIAFARVDGALLKPELGNSDHSASVLHLVDRLFSEHRAVTTLHINSECSQYTTSFSRSAFYQSPALWYRGDNGGSHPEFWNHAENGIAHPLRKYLPRGALYRRHVPSLNAEMSLRRLDIDTDLDRFTQWMNQPRVDAFWEQAWSKAKQRDYLETTLADPHKQPVIGCIDDEPFGYFEIYWAAEDRLGPYYDVHPYDRGVHLLVGEKRFLGRKYFLTALNCLSHFMFLDDPRTQRLVGEPRYDNVVLLNYLTALPAWQKIKEFDFPHKRAALLMCQREDFFREAIFS